MYKISNSRRTDDMLSPKSFHKIQNCRYDMLQQRQYGQYAEIQKYKSKRNIESLWGLSHNVTMLILF